MNNKVLIVGLGNPGKQYEKTRHNIGFLAIDAFAKKHDMIFDKNKYQGIYSQKNLFNQEVFLLKPETFMNLSGQCVVRFANYFKITLDNVYIVYDDLDTLLGKIKYKTTGSSGGQRGMKNIIELYGTENIKRFKLGIGMNDRKMDAATYVLAKFLESEINVVNHMIKDLGLKIDEMLQKKSV